MKKVLVPIAEGFEEIETMTIVDVLRRAGCEVVLAGVREGPITGSRKVTVIPDALFADVKDDKFDLIVIPGGQPGVNHLKTEEALLELLRRADSERIAIGAICAAPLVLKAAGIEKGKKLTSYPGLERDLADAHYSEARVVRDGRLVTSRGPGSAMEFALELVSLLAGAEKAEALKRDMVVE